VESLYFWKIASQSFRLPPAPLLCSDFPSARCPAAVLPAMCRAPVAPRCSNRATCRSCARAAASSTRAGLSPPCHATLLSAEPLSAAAYHRRSPTGVVGLRLAVHLSLPLYRTAPPFKARPKPPRSPSLPSSPRASSRAVKPSAGIPRRPDLPHLNSSTLKLPHRFSLPLNPPSPSFALSSAGIEEIPCRHSRR
jgi:hypothetical protein